MNPEAFYPLDQIVLALGANLGERLATFNRARRGLERQGVRITHRSRLYWTHPIGNPADPGYLNAILVVQTRLRPIELLDRCLEIERDCGRIRRRRWEPRTLDIDLIFYRGAAMNHPRLKLPHPRWAERDFILAPICDLGIALPHLQKGAIGCPRDRLAHAPRTIVTSRPWP